MTGQGNDGGRYNIFAMKSQGVGAPDHDFMIKESKARLEQLQKQYEKYHLNAANQKWQH